MDYNEIQSALSDVHIKDFMFFMRQCDINYNLKKIPYRALKSHLMFDQRYVNVYMRFIAAGYNIHPVIEDINGEIIDGHNRAQAFSQMEMLVPVLRIEFPKDRDLITLVGEFKEWCKVDGKDDVSRWVTGNG